MWGRSFELSFTAQRTYRRHSIFMKFASVISFFFLFFCVCVCAARACAMTPVWRSEDSFAGVSSPTFMLAWARAVSAFYSQNHLSGPHLFFVFDTRGAASWIQRAWLHTGDISELWRTFFSPLVMNRGRGPGEHTRHREQYIS